MPPQLHYHRLKFYCCRLGPNFLWGGVKHTVSMQYGGAYCFIDSTGSMQTIQWGVKEEKVLLTTINQLLLKNKQQLKHNNQSAKAVQLCQNSELLLSVSHKPKSDMDDWLLMQPIWGEKCSKLKAWLLYYGTMCHLPSFHFYRIHTHTHTSLIHISSLPHQNCSCSY